jgi:hypothetical protein
MNPSEKPLELNGFVAVGALSGLLLPAGLGLLLAAAGLLPAALTDARSWYALIVGMFLCGFGVCTAPLGLPVLFRLLGVPVNAVPALKKFLTNAWLLSAATLGLAAYGAWKLWPVLAAIGNDAGSNAMYGAICLLAGNGVRLALEIAALRKRLQFGAVTLEPDLIKCGPGEKAQTVLRMSKKAASVEASLELCTEEEGEAVILPAKVGPAEPGAEGWTYRVSVVVPADVPLKGEDSWLLSVKARGARGVEIYLQADIERRE